MSLLRKMDIGFQDSAAIDAFCRLRVSNPATIFDSKQIFDDSDISANAENDPLFYDNVELSGSGTATAYNVNTASTTLSVSNLTAGVRVRQSKLRFNYQPGKSLMVIMSFLFGTQSSGITRREGYFDANNGIFLEDSGSSYKFVLRTKTSGSPSDSNSVTQASWNIDKMDGSGPSRKALDFTKTQLLFIDFEWLGVGRVRVGFVVDGIVYYAHEFKNTNNLTTVYMSTPNLPLRSELTNSGTGPAATLTQICSTVISEGGQEVLGLVRSASTDGTALTATTTGTQYALLSFRKKSNYIGCSVHIENVDIQVQSASSSVEWSLLLNPTVAGAALSYTDQTNSAIQIAKGVTANTVTGGFKLAGGYAQTGTASTGKASGISRAITDIIRLGSKIDGTRDFIVLVVRPIASSSNVAVEGCLTWHEAV